MTSLIRAWSAKFNKVVAVGDFDNLFDAAISRADDTILDTMATSVQITSGAMEGVVITGVFDDPESISYPAGGIRIEGTAPTLFVKAVLVSQLRRMDMLTVGGEAYWVDRVGPDDCGSCHVVLGRGKPPAGNRRQ
nr:head-tail joining protein [Cedecea lapagei]